MRKIGGSDSIEVVEDYQSDSQKHSPTMNCNYGSLSGQTWPAQAPIGSLLSILKNCDVLLTINGLILEYIKHLGS